MRCGNGFSLSRRGEPVASDQGESSDGRGAAGVGVPQVHPRSTARWRGQPMRVTLCAFLLGSALLTGAAQGQEITLESAPPVVVKTAPEAGASEVDPGTTEVRV